MQAFLVVIIQFYRRLFRQKKTALLAREMHSVCAAATPPHQSSTIVGLCTRALSVLAHPVPASASASSLAANRPAQPASRASTPSTWSQAITPPQRATVVPDSRPWATTREGIAFSVAQWLARFRRKAAGLPRPDARQIGLASRPS